MVHMYVLYMRKMQTPSLNMITCYFLIFAGCIFCHGSSENFTGNNGIKLSNHTPTYFESFVDSLEESEPSTGNNSTSVDVPTPSSEFDGIPEDTRVLDMYCSYKKHVNEIDLLGLKVKLYDGSYCKSPSVAENTRGYTCYCDEQCLLFGDCCADYFKELLQTKLSGMTMDYIVDNRVSIYKNISKRSSDEDYNVYFMTNAKCHSLPSHSPILVILNCPYKMDSILKDKCEGPSFFSPVTLSKSRDLQYVFKNKDCAYCHGFVEREITHWQIKASCNLDNGNKTIKNWDEVLNQCHIDYFPPSRLGHVRYCLHETDATQAELTYDPMDDKNLMYLICKMYRAPLQKESDVYQNIHCVNVFHNNTDNFTCVTKVPSNHHKQEINVNILFEFDADEGHWELVDGMYNGKPGNRCGKDGNCGPKCWPGFINKEGICVMDTADTNMTSYTMPRDQFGSKYYNITLLFLADDILSQRYLDDFVRLSSITLQNDDDRSHDIEFSSVNNENGLSVLQYKIVLYRILPDEVFATFFNAIKSLNHKAVHEITMYNFDPLDLLECNNSFEEIHTNHESQILKGDSPDSEESVVTTSPTLRLSRSRFKIVFSGTPFMPNLTFLAYCAKRYLRLNCSGNLKMYKTDKYKLKDNKLFIRGMSRRFQIGQYQVFGDTLFYCAERLMNENGDFLLTVLSIVCFCFSAIGLLIIIFIHCHFSNLRNIHGKNLASFSVSLLLSQIMLIAIFYANSNPVLCKAVAVFSHYIWLCTFMWSGVMAFDFARKFSARYLISAFQDEAKNEFVKYSCVGWGVPLVCVGTIFLLDITVKDLNVEYGEDVTCWIGNNKANLFLFGVPVAVILCFNLVCFGVAWHGIESTKRSIAVQNRNTGDRRRCFIYTNISLMLGFCWVLAYVASITDIEILNHVSVVLNGLQGFFIFLGFIQSSRVISIFKKKSKNRRDMSSISNVHTQSQKISSVTNRY